jgi:hypothetical protein
MLILRVSVGIDDDDGQDAVEVTLREGLARCREREWSFSAHPT